MRHSRPHLKAPRFATALAVMAMALAGVGLAAQNALAQLGLTETAARTFVLDEIKRAATDRRSPIALAGTRAFFKLPRTARGVAATGLFAWAKAYVGSPAFSASYASYRNGRIPPPREYALTVEAAVKKELDDQLAGVAGMEQAAASMPPADRAAILESVKKARAMFTDPALIKQQQDRLATERAQESSRRAELTAEVEATTPADPRKLFAKRLREFLDATADVNFSARMITLPLGGGADGIEFIDKADRAKPWMWQTAAIVGPEATAAARAAADAWLKEMER